MKKLIITSIITTIFSGVTYSSSAPLISNAEAISIMTGSSIGACKETISDENNKFHRAETQIACNIGLSQKGLRSLYSRALKRRPNLKGYLLVSFTILPSGLVTDVYPKESSINDQNLETEILELFRSITFPVQNVEEWKGIQVVELSK